MTLELGQTDGTGSNAAAGGPGKPARSVEQVRAEILAAAWDLFRRRGYERVTLTEIGAVVGLTRGAVLYHFHSKAEVLSALVDPYVTHITGLIDRLAAAVPAPSPVQVLSGVFDAMLAVRPASELLTRDLSAADAANLSDWSKAQLGRILPLLAPDHDRDPAAKLRAMAAIGALGRPLAVLPDPVPGPDREVVLRAASHALCCVHD